MPVHIGEKHLKKSDTRKTYSDKDVRGFALRTTPLGGFTFYYQHLNKKTGKRDWHLIGAYPEWSIEKARNEARRLAGLAADKVDIKRLRSREVGEARGRAMTFKQLHDEYIDDCATLVRKRWGMVAKKESWRDIRSALKRALQCWGPMLITEITDTHVMDLYKTYVDDDHIPQGNRVRTLLHTLFKWAIVPPRKYLTTNPCTNLPEKEEEVPVDAAAHPDGRVLTANEIRKFWIGLDDPKCPGDRLTKLAYKLYLVTVLRGCEIVAIPRDGVAPDVTNPESVTIPLEVLKGRRSKKSRPVTQPLSSLAREIVAEIFKDDEGRRYAFPGSGKRQGKWMDQKTLAHLLNRKAADRAGKEGILEYLRIPHFTPHDLRRTSATILEQLGYDEAAVGRVMTHKTPAKDASPVTRIHYLVPTPILAKPVDPRVEMLDKLDMALRQIIGLPSPKLKLVA